MKKIKTAFFCQNCGHQSLKWLGKCPSCEEWNRFAEEEIRAIDPAGPAGIEFNESPLPIDEIVADEKERMTTGIAEMDRVLGGGIVNGSVTLVGGDPGIGKSTLLLQVVHNLAEKDLKILYISGEESAKQIKLRGKRLGASSKNLFVLVEIDLDNIVKHIKEISPKAVVIDSIQTMYSPVLTSAPGSVGQVQGVISTSHSPCKKDRHSRLSCRACDQGRLHSRPEGAGTYGGYGTLFRRGLQSRISYHQGHKEQIRADQ